MTNQKRSSQIIRKIPIKLIIAFFLWEIKETFGFQEKIGHMNIQIIRKKKFQLR